MFKQISLSALLILSVSSQSYTNTLESCQQFANLFYNTCDNTQTPTDVKQMASESVSCQIEENCAGD